MTSEPKRNKKYILIVEDEVDFAEALQGSLEQVGYGVILSSRPSDALAKLHLQKFACVLVDLKLKRYSGLKVIRQLRHPNAPDSLNHETPVILMSGGLAKEIVQATIGKVQAVLAKPFKLDTLISKIEELSDAKETTNTDLQPGSAGAPLKIDKAG